MTLLLGLCLASDEVLVAGRVESHIDAPVRVEVILIEAGSPQILLHEEVLDGPGEFRIAIEAHEGTAVLRASADVNLDGAGPDDLQAVLPLDLKGGQTDLVLTLVAPTGD